MLFGLGLHFCSLIFSFVSTDVLMGKKKICREQMENLLLELSEEMDLVNLPKREVLFIDGDTAPQTEIASIL